MKMRVVCGLIVAALLLPGCVKSGPDTTAAVAPPTPLDIVGIPAYPNAKQVSVDIAKPAANGSKRVQAEFSTTDSYTQVVQFYQAKLQLMSAQPPGVKMTQLVGKTPKGTFVQILTGPNGDKTKIQYYFIMPGDKP